MSICTARQYLALILLAACMLVSLPAIAAESGQGYVRERGLQIYVDAGCQVCHGGMGDGGVGTQFVDDPFLAFDDYVVARILMGGGEMPSFEGRISDADIAAVANYIRTKWGAQTSKISAEQVADRKKFLSELAAHTGSRPRVKPGP